MSEFKVLLSLGHKSWRNSIHSVAKKSLKKQEFEIETSRSLKVFEMR